MTDMMHFFKNYLLNKENKDRKISYIFKLHFNLLFSSQKYDSYYIDIFLQKV